MSGENLIDAQPRLDNQSNTPTVTFTLDRLGSQNLEGQPQTMWKKISNSFGRKNN